MNYCGEYLLPPSGCPRRSSARKSETPLARIHPSLVQYAFYLSQFLPFPLAPAYLSLFPPKPLPRPQTLPQPSSPATPPVHPRDTPPDRSPSAQTPDLRACRSPVLRHRRCRCQYRWQQRRARLRRFCHGVLGLVF